MDFAQHLDRIGRLHLLFENDIHLLDLNTGLNPPVLPEVEPPQPDNDIPTHSLPASVEADLVSDGMAASGDPGIVTGNMEGRSIKPGTGHTSTGDRMKAVLIRGNASTHADLNNSFCPLVAISRHPYKYVKGEMSQRIASQFYDEGKFWDRTWDLYYVPVPERINTRPLILVPAQQVQQFFEEIDVALKCGISLLKKCPYGLVLRFTDDGTPQPSYLGQSTNRGAKDFLISRAPLGRVNIPDEHRAAYEDKIQSGFIAIKGQKKADKTVRVQKRLHSEVKLKNFVRHIQSHFGLVGEPPSDLSIEDMIEQENLRNIDENLPIFDMNKPATFPMWKEPIIISLDVEWNEFCKSQVTELGISALDTLDLVGIAPGPEGKNWTERIRSRHYRVLEYSHVVNTQFVAGCPAKFEHGESEWVDLSNLVGVLEKCVKPPYLAPTVHVIPTEVSDDDSEGGVSLMGGVPLMGGVHEAKGKATATGDNHKAKGRGARNIIFIGHGIPNDISHLRDLGTTIFDKTETGPTILETIDTAELFRVWKRENQPRSLASILEEFGIIAWNLHNAGNDARYVMEVIVRIALKAREDADKPEPVASASASASIPTEEPAPTSPEESKTKEEAWL